MGIIDQLRERIIGTPKQIISHLDDDTVIIEAVKRGFGKGGNADPITKWLTRESTTLRKQDLNKWKLAIATATDPKEPDFTSLVELYSNILQDGHLMSVIDSRILKVQQSPFKMVDKNGKENEDMTKLLQDRWFQDFVEAAIMSIFTGSTVLEMWELDEAGELSFINVIPKTHLNLITKDILKEPGSSTKWNYATPPLDTYYMQVGKDHAIGLLSEIAPIILAKKLAIGSWLDFIEKFGIPPRWVITDREDTTRLKELFNMMRAMISNQFAVLRGNEKIEIAPTPNTDAYEVFDKLIERMNSEISKRVLGATGTTDEKSFVGSANVHERMANDRHESDRIFIRNLVNKELIPKIAKISSVYTPLLNYRFDWDYTEDMSAKDIIDSVSKLSNSYHFDIERLAELTGLPITGIRNYNEDTASGKKKDEEEEGSKKKA